MSFKLLKTTGNNIVLINTDHIVSAYDYKGMDGYETNVIMAVNDLEYQFRMTIDEFLRIIK